MQSGGSMNYNVQGQGANFKLLPNQNKYKVHYLIWSLFSNETVKLI